MYLPWFRQKVGSQKLGEFWYKHSRYSPDSTIDAACVHDKNLVAPGRGLQKCLSNLCVWEDSVASITDFDSGTCTEFQESWFWTTTHSDSDTILEKE